MYPKIETASVKVMRSHDYCHFEVCMSTSDAATPEAVDNLRKEAARLADKAVAQYRIAKENAENLMLEKQTRGYVMQEADRIRNIPEADRTVREQATLKAFDDEQYHASREYDYEDDWQD